MVPKRADHPCITCQARKVKCDRILPSCSSCVAREESDKCSYESSKKKVRLAREENTIDPELSKIWEVYEHIWLYQLLGQVDPIRDNNFHPDLSRAKEFKEVCFELITEKISYKILDYSMERLGALYFGLFSDIGEIYLKLNQFWDSIEETHPTTVDDQIWRALIWSIITTTIYFIPLDELSVLFDPAPVQRYLGIQDGNELKWTLELHNEFFELCMKYTISQLVGIVNIIKPNIKIIQSFLILCNTSFSVEFPSLCNNILISSINLAKVLGLNNMRLKTNESASIRLVKLVSQKIWFRLSGVDYLRSSPMKIISLHRENTSIVSQSLLLNYNDPNNVDVYDSEDTWESLYWKVISLERDLNDANVPTIKMLQGVRKSITIFEGRLQSLKSEESYSSQVEYFVTKIYLEFVLWKTIKSEFVHYNVSNGFEKICDQTRRLIALFLLNVKKNFHAINRHISCFRILSVVSGFHSYYSIFIDSEDNEELFLDCLEIIQSISPFFKRAGFLLYENLIRLYSMKNLWKRVKIVDRDNHLIHPVIHILRKDITAFEAQLHVSPRIISNVDLFDENIDRGEMTQSITSEEFNSIIEEFLSTNPVVLYVE